jgi:hypothetical protein
MKTHFYVFHVYENRNSLANFCADVLTWKFFKNPSSVYLQVGYLAVLSE